MLIAICICNKVTHCVYFSVHLLNIYETTARVHFTKRYEFTMEVIKNVPDMIQLKLRKNKGSMWFLKRLKNESKSKDK